MAYATDLFTVVWGQDGKGWHSVDRKGFGNGRRKRLRKERDTAFRLAPRWEEVTLVALVALRDEEWRSPQASTTIRSIDLVVQELLDMLDGQQVLAIHGNDDGVPYLRHQYLNETIVRGQHRRQEEEVSTLGLYLTSISDVAKIFE